MVVFNQEMLFGRVGKKLQVLAFSLRLSTRNVVTPLRSGALLSARWRRSNPVRTRRLCACPSAQSIRVTS